MRLEKNTSKKLKEVRDDHQVHIYRFWEIDRLSQFRSKLDQSGVYYNSFLASGLLMRFKDTSNTQVKGITS